MKTDILKLYIGHRFMTTGGQGPFKLCGYNIYQGYAQNAIGDDTFELDEIKLILRPLSSMTEDEKKERLSFYRWVTDTLEKVVERDAMVINWLRGLGFDCDGLIESGDALDGTKL